MINPVGIAFIVPSVINGKQKKLNQERINKMMSRKNYKEIAKILAMYNDMPEYKSILGDITSELANYFESDNPRFDRNRFHVAVMKG